MRGSIDRVTFKFRIRLWGGQQPRLIILYLMVPRVNISFPVGARMTRAMFAARYTRTVNPKPCLARAQHPPAAAAREGRRCESAPGARGGSFKRQRASCAFGRRAAPRVTRYYAYTGSDTTEKVHSASRATIYWLTLARARPGSSLKRSPDARRNRCRGNCASRELLSADTLYYIDSRARERLPVSPERGFQGGGKGRWHRHPLAGGGASRFVKFYRNAR